MTFSAFDIWALYILMNQCFPLHIFPFILDLYVSYIYASKNISRNILSSHILLFVNAGMYSM